MPTKGKKPVGFFQSCGAKIDQALAWFGTKLEWLRKTYRTANDTYIKTIRKKQVGKILPPSLVVLAMFLVMLPIYTIQIVNNSAFLYDRSYDVYTAAPETLSEGEVSQEFQGKKTSRSLSRIGIMVGTHARTNHAEYEFLVKENGEVMRSQVFSAANLKDNNYAYFDFAPIQLSENSEYSFVIRAINTSEDNAIALYYDTATGDVVYQASGRSAFYAPVIIISAVFLIAFLVINYLINSGKLKNEFRYLACMLVYIIPLVFIYPVNTIPDEFYHFSSTLRLAQYDWSEDWGYNTSARHDLYLPTNGGCLTKIHVIPEQQQISNCAASESDTAVVSAITEQIWATRGMAAYAPAALGVMVGDLISDSPLVIYYFGRAFNLLAVGAIIAFALSLIKKHRLVLLSIILLPMFLQQAASYSYDAMLNSLCILMIAYGIRFLTTDATVRKRDFIIMTLAIIFIGLIKVPYLAVVTPLFFVKWDKFAKHKFVKWLFLGSALAVAVLVYLLDGHIVAIAGAEGFQLAANGRGMPLSSLLHPRAFAKRFLHTLWSQSWSYITSAIGFFGWFHFQLNPILVVAYVVFLIALTLSGQSKFSKAMRILTFLAMLALIGSIFLAMYLDYTTEAAPIIEGVQGRYFLPAIPLLMLVLMPKKNKLNLTENTCYTFLSLITLCYVVTLLVGYY